MSRCRSGLIDAKRSLSKAGHENPDHEAAGQIIGHQNPDEIFHPDFLHIFSCIFRLNFMIKSKESPTR